MVGRVRLAAVAVIWLALARPALAFEARVGEVRAFGRIIRAAVELRDAIADRFQTLIQRGGTLHVHIAAELWEDRPAWDRLVRPTSLAAFQIRREPATGSIVVADTSGEVARYAGAPRVISVRVDLSPVDYVLDDRRYYVHVVATLGTIAQEEIEGLDEAVRQQSGGLGSVARFVFRNLLQINEYLQSRTSETTGGRVNGKEIRRAR